ncbi:hypothetical protein HS088_TW21G01405 [Tripterygium wilfordii]|uniref:TCP domain-containing protein n=1 Tax=Tripterygium wilfordii TaxID=458696 RepID=A0A7J7C5L9_TRIWF|nr:hypothetical protein HS088_TW21G01405 [Tripterygium wilfordii]
MFTSTNTSVTPFSHLPSSTSSYNHSHPPPLPPPQRPHFFVQEARHDDGILYPHYHNHQDPSFSNTQMPISTENKDYNRHRKICTSQGVRDRRVRLSIDIARKFFDLQDMLGFDKASKTLEWLLVKSRNSIKNLSEPNHNINILSTTSVASENGDLEGILNLPKNISSSLVGVSSTPDHQSKMKKIMVNLAAQKLIRSTARARARAGIMTSSLKFDLDPIQIEDVDSQIPRQESILINTSFPNLPQNWEMSNAITSRDLTLPQSQQMRAHLEVYI